MINDVNDNRPVFPNDSITLNVTENTLENILVSSQTLKIKGTTCVYER